eukprot:gb/GFBE01000680.1/.p1 GENE.gb/GFBE01000680.1/~~gb/GFBE01000680.1/.p1  ORF type:complete len:554 (+),score=107.73 gb/GFBE01000680.1/:1-1662(+)
MQLSQSQTLLPGRLTGSWAPNWTSSCSLEDFREFDPDAVVGSPRSLAACDAQGILPRDLRYKPLELFQLPGLDPRVAQLRYDFMESRRQDTLAAARSTRAAIIELSAEAERGALGTGTAGSLHEKKGEGGRNADLHTALQPSWQEGGPPDPSLAGAPTTPYPVALEWFHQVLGEYSVSNAQASPPSSPKAGEEMDLGMSQVTLPPVSPKSPSSTQKRSSDTALQRAASEPEIRNLLGRVKGAPRASRADEDFAKKSEDIHIVYPKLQGKWRRRANEDELRLTSRRVEMATDTFDRLVIIDEEDYQSLKFRDMMHAQAHEDDPTIIRSLSPAQAPPASPFNTLSSSRGMRTKLFSSGSLGGSLGGSMGGTLKLGSSGGSTGSLGSTGRPRVSHEERQENAREKNLSLIRDKEIHRAEVLHQKVTHHQKMTERLIDDAAAKRWKVAQELLEERIKWRDSYHKVATQAEEHERFKRDFFARREEQQRQQRARCDDSSAVRKEIRHLRDVNRMLNQVQRDRKEAWRHAKKQREVMEKRMAASGLKMTLPKSPIGSFC